MSKEHIPWLGKGTVNDAVNQDSSSTLGFIGYETEIRKDQGGMLTKLGTTGGTPLLTK